ncbi:fibrinogen-like protein 1 [Haliotis rufescens]|uniref:fibrinogen-like protein 1 n=1 Tax=Haliotis rufescens TaxID=6454 RepID=UPI00201FA698|nr:fibrinogen-like protein 1 [Haliotis rufescens]
MQDCTEGSEYYDKEKGLFFIQPRSSKAIFRVFCNMIWGGRSYMMIIEKDGPYMNFTRSWQEYKDGFGVSEYDVINKKGSFWAGNEMLHQLTTSRRYTLTVEAGYETYKQYIYEGFVVRITYTILTAKRNAKHI